MSLFGNNEGIRNQEEEPPQGGKVRGKKENAIILLTAF